MYHSAVKQYIEIWRERYIHELEWVEHFIVHAEMFRSLNEKEETLSMSTYIKIYQVYKKKTFRSVPYAGPKLNEIKQNEIKLLHEKKKSK